MQVDVRDAGLIPESGRSPGGWHGNLLHILAWRIPWTEEPGRLQSQGCTESDMSEVTQHVHMQLCIESLELYSNEITRFETDDVLQMSIVYIYELDISLYFYVSFSSSIKLKPTINFMGNFKYNLFLCVCCNSIMCIREMFSLLCFQRAYFTKKKKLF